MTHNYFHLKVSPSFCYFWVVAVRPCGWDNCLGSDPGLYTTRSAPSWQGQGEFRDGPLPPRLTSRDKYPQWSRHSRHSRHSLHRRRGISLDDSELKLGGRMSAWGTHSQMLGMLRRWIHLYRDGVLQESTFETKQKSGKWITHRVHAIDTVDGTESSLTSIWFALVLPSWLDFALFTINSMHIPWKMSTPYPQ